MRGGRLLAAVLFLVGLVTVLEAQQPGRQGGQGGGMFGRGGTDVNTVILTNEALQEEIKVTAEQKEKFKPVAAKQTEFQKKMAEMAGKGGKGGKGKGGGFAEIGKERQAIADEAKTLVSTTLTTEQKARL